MEWRNPKPTVDIIIRFGEQVVLIRRRNPPHGWALPGGFVDEWERVEDAAVREALEETQLHVVLDELLYVYSDPRRDPRAHTLSVVFTAKATEKPMAADDAEDAQLFELDALPEGIVFDHEEILDHYKHFLATGERPAPHSFVS
jgi:8-oxo-dGTP diphosphatase